MLGPGTAGVHHETDSDQLIVFESPPGKSPVRYDIGVGWDRSRDGAAPDLAGWTKTVERHARELAAPVRVTLTGGAGRRARSVRKAEVALGVPEADVLDQAAEQIAIVREQAALDVVAEQVAEQRAGSIRGARYDRKLRESVSMPTKRDSRPMFDSALHLLLHAVELIEEPPGAAELHLARRLTPSWKLPIIVAKSSLSRGLRL